MPIRKLFNGSLIKSGMTMVNNQKGVVHLLPLLLLLAGIIAGVYLVQHTQIFKPKAAVKNIEFSASENKDANGNPCRVFEENGRLKTNCPEVKIKFTSPLETQGSSDGSSQLVKTSYAQGTDDYFFAPDTTPTIPEGSRFFCKEENQSKIYWYAIDIGPIKFWELSRDCPRDQDGNERFCTALDQGAGCRVRGPLANIEPKGIVNLDLLANQITFYWTGPSNAKRYRFFIDSDQDTRKAWYNTCGSDFGGYLLCAEKWGEDSNHRSLSKYGHNLDGGRLSVFSGLFQTDTTYTWWVDALDKNDKTIGTSQDFQITIRKAKAADKTEEEPQESPVPTPRSVPRATPVSTPATAPTITVCNANAAIGMPSSVQTPVNYKWTVDCDSSCKDTTKHDCPKSTDQFVCPSTSNWCYDFGGNVGKKCLQLEYIGVRTGPIPGAPGGPVCPERPAPAETKVTTCKGESKTWAQIDAELRAANYDGVYDHSQTELDAYNRAACPAGAPAAPADVGPTAPQPVEPPQRVTTGYRFAESPTELANLSFSPYTPGGVSVTHPFADPATGPHFIFVQFQYNNSSSDLSQVYTATIELVGPSAPASQPPPPPPPAGGTATPCSQFETYNVCGGGVLTYDKCTDDKGQTGSQLCSGQATKFYCEGSGNSNCISDPTKQGNYYCSACPNLVGRGTSQVISPLGIANCYVRPARVNIGGSVTYQVLVQGGKPPYYFNLTGDFSRSVTSQTNTTEIVQTFDSAGLKRVNLIVGSGSEQSNTFCPAVQVSSFDRSIEATNIPSGSACSAYETTSVCGGGFKTYDKCTDNRGQTGSQLCLGGATTFYCVGSTNANCDSSGGTRVGNYSCSGCPNLSNR